MADDLVAVRLVAGVENRHSVIDGDRSAKGINTCFVEAKLASDSIHADGGFRIHKQRIGPATCLIQQCVKRL
ncbi:hypothetical protein D3C74_479010 [compost metagenome]